MNFAIVLAGLSLTLGLFALWMCVCNTATYRHRIKLIDAIFDCNSWMERNAEFKRVSYEAHLWRLMLLGNPWALYSPQLRELIGAAP